MTLLSLMTDPRTAGESLKASERRWLQSIETGIDIEDRRLEALFDRRRSGARSRSPGSGKTAARGRSTGSERQAGGSATATSRRRLMSPPLLAEIKADPDGVFWG